jgi:hypothetical protein
MLQPCLLTFVCLLAARCGHARTAWLAALGVNAGDPRARVGGGARCRPTAVHADRLRGVMVPGPSLRELVERVRELPYGRPSDRTVEGMLREDHGICSTKHLFLARGVGTAVRGPNRGSSPRLHAGPGDALQRYGEAVAEAVPPAGIVAVHRYLTARIGGRRVMIDATFPSRAQWDGISSMPLASGPAWTIRPSGSGIDKRSWRRVTATRACAKRSSKRSGHPYDED